MYSQRPRIKVATEPTDWILEILWLAALAWLVVPALNAWPSLPEQIPVHFDAAGNPDSWGGRGTLWILQLIGLFTSGVLWLVARFPHLHNFPFEITEGNAPWAYSWSVRLLRVMRLLITTTFALVVNAIVQISLGREPLPTSLFFAAIALTVVIPIVTAILVFRKGRSTD